MGDISEVVGEQSPIAAAVYKWWKKRGDSEPMRSYLGASIIGHECDRYLWYSFRHCVKESFSGRMYRLFYRGQKEEETIKMELEGIGCQVIDRDEETGEQIGISFAGGHCKGHIDGMVLGVPGAEKSWHVLEDKTHSTKSYRKVVAYGVEKAKIMHYVQMQLYMYFLKVNRALYYPVAKETDHLDPERAKLDKKLAEKHIKRAEDIVEAKDVPMRQFKDPECMTCTFCAASDLCWGNPEKPAVPVPCISCRQCCHATPEKDGDGRWVCSKKDINLSRPEQDRACPEHLFLPGLFIFAEPTDGSMDHMDMKNAGSGFEWKHGRGKRCFTSEALASMSVKLMNHKIVGEAMDKFDGTVVGEDKPRDLFEEYAKDGAKNVWNGPVGKLESQWKRMYKEYLPELEPLRTMDPRHDGVTCAEYERNRLAAVYGNTAGIWEK